MEQFGLHAINPDLVPKRFLCISITAIVSLYQLIIAVLTAVTVVLGMIYPFVRSYHMSFVYGVYNSTHDRRCVM